MNTARRLSQLSIALFLVTIISSWLYWWRLEQSHNHLRAETLAQTTQRAVQLANLQAQHMESLIYSFDLALRQYQRAVQRGNFVAADEIAETSRLALTEGAIITFAMFDENGTNSYSAGKTVPNNVQDRDYFKFHRNSNEDRLFITKPIVGKVSGRWALLITRPVIRKDRFAGVAAMSISLDFIANMLASLEPDKDDIAAMVYKDGSYLARSRNLNQVLGKSVSRDRPFLKQDAPERGSFRAGGTSDGVQRVFAWHSLKSFPLIVVVGLDEETTLGLTEREIGTNRLRSIIGNALLVFLVILIAFLLRRASRQHEALERSNNRFEKTAETVPVILYDYILNPDGSNRFLYMSHRSKEVMGIDADAAMNDSAVFWRLVHPDDIQRLQQEDLEANKTGTKFRSEFRITLPTGETRWLLVESKPSGIREKGQPVVWSGYVLDVTDRKLAEENLLKMAATDFLTGLSSRRSFISRIEDELARIHRGIEQPTTLLMLDLDHFKKINDRHGHAAGDATLKHFSELLMDELRRIDMVGRLGGEEFGIILPGANEAAALALANRLCQRVAQSPPQYQGVNISLTVSIGVARLNASDSDPYEALARADKALYKAKERGRNRVERYAEEVS